MSKFNYDGPRQFKPVSAWGYIGYSILFAIPIIGLILLIVFAFSDRNINRRNFARSYFCWILIGIILSVLITAGLFTGLLSDSLKDKLSAAPNAVLDYSNRILNRAPRPTVRPIVQDSGVTRQEQPAEEQQDAPEEKATAVPEENAASSPSEPMAEVQIGNRTLSISKAFKEAMDGYEVFFDDYIDAVTTQNVIKLSTLMLKYGETLEAFDRIKDEDLSEAEMAYYTEIHARIMGKLASVEG